MGQDINMHSQSRVLIVEDEFLVALDLEDMLHQAGHEVLGIASDCSSARSISADPQVAFVDLNLNDGPTGAAIAAQLSELYGTAIVYVTANPMQIGCPASMAIGYIQKPYSREAILTALEVALGDGGISGTTHRELALFQPASVRR